MKTKDPSHRATLGFPARRPCLRLTGVCPWLAFALILGCISPAVPLAAQARQKTASPYPSSFSLTVQPVFSLPLVESSGYFMPGGGLHLEAEYGFAGNPQLFLAGGLDYAFLPVKDETSSVSLVTALAGGGVYFWLTPRLGLRAALQGGGYVGFIQPGGAASGQIALRGGVELAYLLVPTVNLALGAAYLWDLGTYQGLALTASAAYFLRGREGRQLAIEQSRRKTSETARTPRKGRGLELADVHLSEVFPVFLKYYDDHPVGTVTLRNLEAGPITDIKLLFLVRQFMDSPKQCPSPAELGPGASLEVQVMSLLTDRVLEVTEPTKVAAELTLEYLLDGDLYRSTRIVTVRLLDRNALTWDDDRKVAAFVTRKDPAVLAAAKSAAGLARELGPVSLNPNLRTAMAVFTAMEQYGLSYVVDPKTPFVEFSRDSKLVDFLQFPRETLSYKAGDCDDLSVLFSALLESVGVDTAFVTVPGHIFLAFSTGLSAEEAGRSFPDSRELILESGECWLPVETTVRAGGFLKAWAEGARQWREGSSRGSARFSRVHSAWKLYEPVGLPGSAPEIVLPDRAVVSSALQRELAAYVQRDIAPRVAALEASQRTSGETAQTRNKLGVLYAHYGRYGQAESEFRKAIALTEFVPALLNLGNLFVLQGQPARGREYYERAARREPGNPKALLGLAICYHAAEEFGQARSTYERLASVDRTLADRYAYLGGGAEAAGRAGLSEAAPRVQWAE